MNDPIIHKDVIKAQARRAVDAGKPATDCPYERDSRYAKRWLGAYLMREAELHDQSKEASCATR